MEILEGFFRSCQEGKLAEVGSFLSGGLSPDAQNTEGETALQISAANGFTDIVLLLLNKRASVDLANNYGWTPLMHAARHGHFEVVSLLIRRKAKININNRLGVRAIDVAAWHGNKSCVELIVESGAIVDIGLESELCDISPLMAASLQGHTAILKKLLKSGSSPNQTSSITGLTPLMLAACKDYQDIVEILIEHGSDANLTDICDRTALDLATICCRENIIIYLRNVTIQNIQKSVESGNSEDNILRILRSGNIIKATSLLKKKPFLSSYVDPEEGVTPLMVASMMGFADIVDLLISYGADLNSQDLKNGWTPLMYAVFHRQSEIVHLLIDRGVDIDIYTSNGYTALDLALHIDSSETDILKTLLEHFGTEEVLYPEDYFDASFEASSSTLKQSHLTAQMPTSKSDSQAKFKDLLGGFSSHFRQFSRSSAVSPTVDLENSTETLQDVFPDENSEDLPQHFLCLSKFYAPSERFSHLVKELRERSLRLPPLPFRDIVEEKTDSDEDLSNQNISTKPPFNSLRVPNLLRRMKEDFSVKSNNVHKKHIFSESLNVGDISSVSEKSVNNLEPDSSLHLKDDAVLKENNQDLGSTLEGTAKKNILELDGETLTIFSSMDSNDLKSDSNKEDAVAAKGLSALLDQESLRNYVEKFRDQEIDLETFKYLTEKDLDEIGINSLDSRHKLMEIIDKLKNS